MSQRYLNTQQAKQLAVHWARTEPIVRIYIASAIGQHHLIDDIVQEVATIVTEKFEDYDPEFEFSRWAIGIARNRIAKSIRSKVRDRHVFSSAMIHDLAGVVSEMQPEVDARKSALKDCLEGLKGRSRRIIEMRYQWGRQVQKIAEELGMSRVAVSAVLLRSRKALGDCIEARLKKEDRSP
ncbi:MAG: sigma-70 family RNA polymerase sigma factor [Phycisphaeraceae bacterium]|nr:sigma-70 family RNA polymerase sigma factor [Phycisphaeraceae bacterium]